MIPTAAAPIIDALTEGLRQLKPNGIDGIYLTGSITLGDFYPYKSDIDFLVLYSEPLSQVDVDQLASLHRRIQQAYPKPVLNGVYLTRQNLQVDTVATGQVIHFQDGKLKHDLFDMGPITLYELKTVAYTITGLPANQLPIAIDLEHVKSFMYDNINSYWRRWLASYSSLVNRKGLLVLFPGLTEWGVLGIARQVATLKLGKIVSKKTAGVSCLAEIPDPYRSVLEQAIQIRMSMPSWANSSLKNIYSIRPSWKRATQTIECMHYLIALFNDTYLEQQSVRE